MELANIARVAVSAATYSIDKPYDYQIPEKLLEKVRPGVRVIVPFGKGNKTSEGFVLAVGQESKQGELKAIREVLDDESVLGSRQIKLALWLRERYFCTLYNAVKVLLPAGLWYRLREVCTLSVSRETALEAGANERESRILEALAAHGGSAEVETLRLACGETAGTVVRELHRRGLVTIDAAAGRKISDKQASQASLAVSVEEAMAAVEPKRRSAPMRYEVVKLLCTIGSAMTSDICYFTGATRRTLKSLEKSGLVVLSQVEVLRVPKAGPADGAPIVLTEEQQAAYDAVSEKLDQGAASCALLYG
ncbi:MAG: primosomal protein N', partial [Oscillospiraceae bacterium]|nr:primosomal protein N' [Oscillospiraceae bacterium]